MKAIIKPHYNVKEEDYKAMFHSDTLKMSLKYLLDSVLKFRNAYHEYKTGTGCGAIFDLKMCYHECLRDHLRFLKFNLTHIIHEDDFDLCVDILERVKEDFNHVVNEFNNKKLSSQTPLQEFDCVLTF